MTNPQILADNYKKILTILNNIIKNEDNNPLIDYPVLIGSRAAKWHIFSFREPNDWDLMATPLQTTLFINKIKESNATFKNIKLIYYPGGGLKLAGEYIDQYTTDKKLISFDIELVSEKVDLRNMKSIFEDNSEDNMKVDNMQDDVEFNFDVFEDDSKKSNVEDSEDNMQDDVELNFDVFENNSKKSNAEDSEDNMKDEINKIEFERFNDVHPKMSALMILELCRNIEDKTMLPLLSNFLCIVAPLKILEALKTSQIYWPADFHKNISDLHLLRDYNKDKVSIIQPLCSPQRDELIELILETRIKETEIIQGKPGEHINLNMSNDDFLENEDNLFVQKCIPREDLHELVKYGDHPIYQGLRDGQSKALIKKFLFEKLDYQTKINCIKEEAMVIALERYLIPMISKDQENSYKLALVRICTTLTKVWFRQFAIDNYPRLSNLDKDLLSIAHNIIEKFPVKQKKPDVILLDPETQAIFESIRPYTKTISSFDKIRDYNDYFTVVERTGINITSPINSDVSVTAIITNMQKANYEEYLSASWTASVVILPTNDLEILSEDEDEGSDEDKDYDDSDSFDMDDVNIEFKDPLKIHPYQESYSGKFSKLNSKHIFVLGIDAYWIRGMGVEEIWRPITIKVKSADFVASLLEIPELTGDLLFKYMLDCLKPTLIDVGETPLRHWVNKLKSNGTIPIEPNQHLWYYAWNYKLNRKFE
ncbi:uncharacterized protein OCT59_019114 [Rhizophagus irregularis]|uniref:Uncharacterized protein n=3 Tax=Rhizophagus irregularis TaxID=588596 RepID=U9T3I2_RHIID|nr:hypothetical protein GLOIN_2v1790160 [Rhizophagus irregularis DAOM 181602=DAOM 197198]EXX65866.1 hypothetical protein RirG_129230 [Rhizophagus irregularis DAOM 197198w]UZO26902.1 hypothetical protein OCT59_019114 [Rhizophagus irregularis]POG58613.1 hypothetical protein GLOIN_2v1790160 [Rhizophagus irregularis DAOM 181602=DAOM 197198]CAG8628368.1 14909_t:CDS:2 [Rhizophagus irregularis]GBC33991.1 hypothetical protein GLOIN_2v1790160 [Rhizophagus irregularis DAOM 181602=DAOM 197198]|eukprot:XP_025165479.1 hypothetical protein GLOIN_2v1790160 [Rhizophagus irregularis DAOM 181602=DAOM 197198]